MEKGKLIVFEGASDGIGKSTQIELLRKRLESEGYVIVSHHFPTYHTYHGAPVEEYLAGNLGNINDVEFAFATNKGLVKVIIKDKKILLVHKIKSDKYALFYWCLQYQEYIKVLEPKSLVDDIVKTLEQSLNKYK